MGKLFFDNNNACFAVEAMRAAARSEVENSWLIQRAWHGDLRAVIALKQGFWFFVREFELAIDAQVIAMDRGALIRRFGRRKAMEVLASSGRAMREMKREEGEHSQAWLEDAQYIGLATLEDMSIPGVDALVTSAFDRDMPHFFSVLAGTEFIAEELSKFLLTSPAYLNLFGRGIWKWGEIHAAPHAEGEVSHLLLDLDFARALLPGEADNVTRIEEMIVETIHLFGRAASDVAGRLMPSRAAA